MAEPSVAADLRTDSAFGLGMTGIETALAVVFINMSFPPGEGLEGLGTTGLRLGLVGLAFVVLRVLRLTLGAALFSAPEEPAGDVVGDGDSRPESEPQEGSASAEGSGSVKRAQARTAGPVWLLDTSAIIDGRIEALLGAGLLGGRLVVPRAVTRELQGLADDGRKGPRERGRRGLEVLGRLRERFGEAFDEVRDEVRDDARDGDAARDDGGPVDEQLVALIRAGAGRLVTADVPLAGRVAGEGLPVLDLRALAKAMVGQVSSGDRLRVTITRSGEKRGQGTASLADGAMVVVEGGGPYIGDEVEVEVVSSIRRRNGPLYFARILDQSAGEESPGEDRDQGQGEDRGEDQDEDRDDAGGHDSGSTGDSAGASRAATGQGGEEA